MPVPLSTAHNRRFPHRLSLHAFFNQYALKRSILFGEGTPLQKLDCRISSDTGDPSVPLPAQEDRGDSASKAPSIERSGLAKLSVLIADDHELVRRGVRSILEAQPGWEVVGEASDGQQALERARALKPEIVVLDIGMPRLSGLEAARRIGKILPQVKILILSMHDSNELARAVLEAGARGYVTKSDAARDLVTAVDALHKNKSFFTARVQQMVLECFLRRGSAKNSVGKSGRLTSRQTEIVQLLSEGRSSKEIAAILNLSLKTIETHRANIMRKLDCHSVSELVVHAIRNKIVQLD
jgi:DNA-binding NarL/FixJ family response regulator